MFGAYILDTAEFEENIDFLKESGIRSLIFGFATPPKVLQSAGENFEVYLEYQPFAPGGIQDYLVENVLGEHRDLGPLGCPTNVELQRANLHKLEKRLSEGHVSGVILDLVRYPSPANETFFYSCFCKNCRQTSKSMGYDIDEFKKKHRTVYKKPKLRTPRPLAGIQKRGHLKLCKRILKTHQNKEERLPILTLHSPPRWSGLCQPFLLPGQDPSNALSRRQPRPSLHRLRNIFSSLRTSLKRTYKNIQTSRPRKTRQSHNPRIPKNGWNARRNHQKRGQKSSPALQHRSPTNSNDPRYPPRKGCKTHTTSPKRSRRRTPIRVKRKI